MTDRPVARLRSRPPRRRVLVLFVLLLALVLVLPALIKLAAEWLWFQEVGYERVFSTRLLTETLLALLVGGAAFGFLYGNLRFAQRGVVPEPPLVQVGGPGTIPLDVTRLLRRLALPAALGVGLLFGLGATRAWLGVLQFLHRVPFGTTDPVFGRDLWYYVFTLPVVAGVTGIVTALTLLTLIAVLFVYVLRRDLVLAPPRIVTIEPSARVHIAGLVALLFLLAAARVFLVRLPALLYSTTGPLVGASYADLHATLPALRLVGIAALIAAGLVVWGGIARRLPRSLVLALGMYFGVSLLGLGIYPAVVQRLVVAPNELVKETPQLVHHIGATRRAWGLETVETGDVSGEASLSERDIRANRPTIDNVRLWDRDPLLQTFGQLQEIRTYYDFVSVDDDRYWIDGQYRQVLLAPRALNPAALPTRAFISEHVTGTHGMGRALGPGNEVTAEGLPVLFIKDLPPASSVSLRVTRPEIYFGEIADSWVFANTRQHEFDYPHGDENVYTSYEGAGGVPVASTARRLLFAAYFRSLKVLLSSDITNESRAMYFRNIRVRASKALPFLHFDADPYLVIDTAGKLLWILDGYTWTTRYPYARAIGGEVNYMRNSVKVTIDAYGG